MHTGAPPVPSGFKVIEQTPNSVTIQWDPASLGGVTYELQYGVENSNDQWMVRQLQNGETSYTLNNLKPNTSYVLMINSLRNTIPSSSAMITVHTRISGIICVLVTCITLYVPILAALRPNNVNYL